MTTPDDTRAALQKILASMPSCSGGCEECTTQLAAALRDSGWVDPDECPGCGRTDFSHEQHCPDLAAGITAHALSLARFDLRAVEAERDALLPVVEAARPWARNQRLVLALGVARTPKTSTDLLAAVDAWESRQSTDVKWSGNTPESREESTDGR